MTKNPRKARFLKYKLDFYARIFQDTKVSLKNKRLIK